MFPTSLIQENCPAHQDSEYFYPALKSLGIKFPIDGADGDAVGGFWAPQSLDPTTEMRSDARTAYYNSAAARANLHLLIGTQVTKLLKKSTSSGICVTEVEVKPSCILFQYSLS